MTIALKKHLSTAHNWHIFGWVTYMCLCVCSLSSHAKFTLTAILHRGWQELNACCGLLVLPQNIFLPLVPIKTNEQHTWWLVSWEAGFQESQVLIKAWSSQVSTGCLCRVSNSRKEVVDCLVYFCPVIEGFLFLEEKRITLWGHCLCMCVYCLHILTVPTGWERVNSTPGEMDDRWMEYRGDGWQT